LFRCRRATALLGMRTMIVGFQVVEEATRPSLPRNATTSAERTLASAAVGCPGVRVVSPEKEVAGPDQYETALFAMVPPAPVKSVADTLAVQLLSPSSVSPTVTGPSGLLIVSPAKALPRLTDAGTVSVMPAGASALVMVVSSSVAYAVVAGSPSTSMRTAAATDEGDRATVYLLAFIRLITAFID
jgi:hypothetical protein